MEEARGATTAALELVCNASTRISWLRFEKMCAHLKKKVQPLAQRDEMFTDAAPYLFKPEFAQKSKEQVEQMRAIQVVLPLAKSHFFKPPPPPGEFGGITTREKRSVQTPLPQGKFQGQEKALQCTILPRSPTEWEGLKVQGTPAEQGAVNQVTTIAVGHFSLLEKKRLKDMLLSIGVTPVETQCAIAGIKASTPHKQLG